MIIEMLGSTGLRVSERDRIAINDLLQGLNPKATERTALDIERRLGVINRNGGVAIIRERGGTIVAMGTWVVNPTLMRTATFASEVGFDQRHPEWRRFLTELLRYLIGRAKSAGAERIDLTWNETRAGYDVFRELGFAEPDTRLLRLLF